MLQAYVSNVSAVFKCMLQVFLKQAWEMGVEVGGPHERGGPTCMHSSRRGHAGRHDSISVQLGIVATACRRVNRSCIVISLMGATGLFGLACPNTNSSGSAAA